jgi:DNA processing protein
VPEEARAHPELELLLLMIPSPGWSNEESARALWRATPLERRVRLAADAARVRALGVRVVASGTAEFPLAASRVRPAVPFLFVRGLGLPDARRAVAVVGTRASTPYGTAIAGRLGAGLGRAGVAVVSGLARGVDAAAHRGALEAGGHTVAVLPGGADTVVPSHHRDLAEEIAERGSVVSEFPRGLPFGRAAFPRRNRLIAALAGAVVVVEAAERSGALSTAAWGRRLGLPVLAVPGDVDRPQSRGCLALLRSGAKPCAELGDVLDCLPAFFAPTAEAMDSGVAPSWRLMRCLTEQPQPVDRLARCAGLAAPEALAGLLELELAGVARALAGQRYVRVGASRPR